MAPFVPRLLRFCPRGSEDFGKTLQASCLSFVLKACQSIGNFLQGFDVFAVHNTTRIGAVRGGIDEH
jgi:hypothetical protein